MPLEDELNAIGDYYEGHPEPPEEPVSDEAQAEYDAAMADWEAGFGEGGPPDPPAPATVPGPPAPGAGMPAARNREPCAPGSGEPDHGFRLIRLDGKPLPSRRT